MATQAEALATLAQARGIVTARLGERPPYPHVRPHPTMAEATDWFFKLGAMHDWDRAVAVECRRIEKERSSLAPVELQHDGRWAA